MTEVVPNCGNCRFALPAAANNVWCRRNPPTVLCAPQVVTNLANEQSISFNLQHFAFPAMQLTGWCGCHEEAKRQILAS